MQSSYKISGSSQPAKATVTNQQFLKVPIQALLARRAALEDAIFALTQLRQCRMKRSKAANSLIRDWNGPAAARPHAQPSEVAARIPVQHKQPVCIGDFFCKQDRSHPIQAST